MIIDKIGCDFDGIICHDMPWGWDRDQASYEAAIASATPLYLPRRSPLPLVVTARPEAMRAATNAWLARWGVRVRRLVMWQGSLGSRTVGAVARFKADEYAASGLSLFVESDDAISQRIFAACGKPVLCPASETVYQ